MSKWAKVDLSTVRDMKKVKNITDSLEKKAHYHHELLKGNILQLKPKERFGGKPFIPLQFYKLADKNGINSNNLRKLMDHLFKYNFPIEEQERNTADVSVQNYQKIKNDIRSMSVQDFAYKVMSNFWNIGSKNIETVLRDAAIPAFFDRYSDGEVWCILLSPWLYGRETVLRVVYSAEEVPELFTVSPWDFKGFNTLKNMQNLSHACLSEFITPLLLMFYPHSYGFLATKMYASLVFLFDKPEMIHPLFPPSLGALYPKEQFHQDRDYIAGDDDFYICKESWSAQDFSKFMRFCIEGLNKAFSYIYDPCNFLDEDLFLDATRQFEAAMMFQRIMMEVLTIQTHYMSHNPFVCKMVCFDVLDKIAFLFKKSGNAPYTGKSPEVDIFKDLLRKSFIGENVLPRLKNIESPYGEPFVKRCEETINSIYDETRKGIFVKGRLVNDEVRIGNAKISFEDYAVNFLRQVRNTKHGYFPERSEKYFAIHDGNISDRLPDLACLYTLLMILDVKSFLEGSFYCKV